MGQRVTILSIINKVRLAADHQGTSLRVTDQDINLLLADAYGRYVGQGSAAGWPYWLTCYESTLPVGRAESETSDYPFGLLDITTSPDPQLARIEGVYRFEIRLPTGVWQELEPVQFQRANDLQGYGEGFTGQPLQYWMHGGSTEDENGHTQQQVAFSPPSDQAYVCRVWYAPVVDTIDQDNENLLEIGPVGGDWWIVWDIVATLHMRDHFSEDAAAASAKQQQVWAELVKRVGGRNKNASFRVQDTKSLRKMSGRRWYGVA